MRKQGPAGRVISSGSAYWLSASSYYAAEPNARIASEFGHNSDRWSQGLKGVRMGSGPLASCVLAPCQWPSSVEELVSKQPSANGR